MQEEMSSLEKIYDDENQANMLTKVVIRVKHQFCTKMVVLSDK